MVKHESNKQLLARKPIESNRSNIRTTKTEIEICRQLTQNRLKYNIHTNLRDASTDNDQTRTNIILKEIDILLVVGR